MSDEPFKLTEEMIAEIEEQVNKVLVDVRSGMKEQLIKAGCYTEWASVEVCEVHIEIETQEVHIIDPVPVYEDEVEEDSWKEVDEEDIF